MTITLYLLGALVIVISIYLLSRSNRNTQKMIISFLQSYTSEHQGYFDPEYNAPFISTTKLVKIAYKDAPIKGRFYGFQDDIYGELFFRYNVPHKEVDFIQQARFVYRQKIKDASFSFLITGYDIDDEPFPKVDFSCSGFSAYTNNEVRMRKLSSYLCEIAKSFKYENMHIHHPRPVFLVRDGYLDIEVVDNFPESKFRPQFLNHILNQGRDLAKAINKN